MSERDPKVDPIVGDSIVCRNKIRKVLEIQGNRIRYSPGMSTFPADEFCSLLEWRAWAATGRVLRKGREVPEVIPPPTRLKSPEEILSGLFSTRR